MVEAGAAFWAAAIPAVLLAGISKGGFGGGLGFAATPLIALAAGPAEAAAIMLPLLILMDQVGIVSYWRRWSLAAALPAIAAAAFGIGAGALAFGSVPPDALRLALGLIALIFVAFQFAQRAGWRPRAGGRRPLRAAIWGWAAGFTSTISHAGGPPITLYLLGERLEKTAFQASTVLIFWAINLMKIGPYAAIGVLDLSTLSRSFSLAPAAFAGVLLGVWAHRHVPERLYFGMMVVLLGLTGAKLAWDGATGLLS